MLALQLLVLLLLAVAGQTGAVKIDCHPIVGATKEKCESLGCVWAPVNRSGIYQDASLTNFKLATSLDNGNANEKPRVDEPWCYFPDDYVGYRVVGKSNRRTRLQRVRPSLFGPEADVKNLEVLFVPDVSLKVIRLQIKDLDQARFEPALPELNFNPVPEIDAEADKLFGEFKIEFQDASGAENNSFFSRIVVKRIRGGGDGIIFSTDLTKLIFADKFIQLNSLLGSPFVYGLGEHFDNFLKLADRYKTYSFYNTDRLPLPGGTRSYGGFPFFVNLDSANNSQAHGVYLHNSNAMDIVLQNDLSVTFRPIGGLLDFYLLNGPTPLEAVEQFQQLVGLPQLPPRWSLGFHLCRFKYNSLARTREITHRTRQAGIPFDVQWNDLDYMDRANDFTYDPVHYKGLPGFVDELHKMNMHYVVLVDPGISKEANYLPYSLGLREDIFIKNATNQVLVGRVWNQSGRTVWPDFSNGASKHYWSELFRKFHQEVPIDGAWIDMNDISNFVDGSLDGCPLASQEPLEAPPYAPGGYALQTKSLCLSAKHAGGSEYNLHNLYSFYEAIATRQALELARPGKRALIISRSTHPGQGSFSGHWSGDVLANWQYLKWSIASLLEHSMFGFNLMGSDICGFAGNTTVPLCARWSSLGAFYTFSRNHNDDTSIDQDPVALGPVVVAANKNAFTKRYSLLPYLYTLIHESSQLGRPVARSMAFEFFQQQDSEALRVEDQFMWGPSLLVAPIVEEGATSKRTYLPEGRWYELDTRPESSSFDVTRVSVPKVVNSRRGQTHQWHETRDVALDNMPLFYRGGSIIPIYADVRPTVPETAAQPMALEIALCPRERAHGSLVLDDGESLDSQAIDKLNMVVEKRTLVINMELDKYAASVEFGQVKVFGLTIKVSQVQLASPAAKSLPFKQKEHMLMFDLAGAKVAKGSPIEVEWA